MIFTHHGDYGDVVYQLMAVKHLCDEAGTPCTFYLSPADDTRASMTAEHAENLLPLLRAQPYIARAEWRAKPLGIRIDVGQRRFWTNGLNIADQMAHWLALPCSGGGGPWLHADPNPMAPVVFSRSQRYRNHRFPWKEAYARFGRQACFVGTHAEHAEFQAQIGPVPIIATPTLLDVARAIAGCKLFVGNQSSPRAIAEGLKVPVIVEMGQHKTCHFARPDAWYDALPPAGILEREADTRLASTANVLCCCAHGLVRSAATKHILQDVHGFRNAVTCGLERNSPELLGKLFAWADRILVAGEGALTEKVSPEFRGKMTHLDVGADTYGHYGDARLQAALRPMIAALVRKDAV